MIDDSTQDPTADDASAQDSTIQDDLEITVLQAENTSLKEEIESLQKDLAAKQEEAPEALKELAARAQADLQNAKERMEREAVEIRKYALESTINKLLPTIDNLQRAFAHLPEDLQDNDWVKGVVSIEQDMMKMLQESGLTVIEAVGQSVDTDKHEVLQAGPGEKDIILEVFENGYELNGKILRPSKVKVGDGS